MSFITGKKLANEIYDTIFYSEKYLLILSPFVQLDKYFKENVFKTHLNNSNVHIILVFGKNEQNIRKSFKTEDIKYFKQFPNITIVYIPKLHAKYYGNERKSIITSMNLIDYSIDNNIEFGVISKKKTIKQNSLFEDTLNESLRIIKEEGYTIFIKRPKYKKKLLGLGKDYVGSDIELDIIDEVLRGKKDKRIEFTGLKNEKYVNAELKGDRIEKEIIITKQEVHKSKNKRGHCIRCNCEISPNIDKPLCYDCFNIWVQYEDSFYPENYCLFCGKKKDVCFSTPACNSCYREYQDNKRRKQQY